MTEAFHLEEATVSTIHTAVREGRLTFAELTQAYLDRIERFDKPSGLNAVISVNPHALARARELDELFQSTGDMAPLAGIPVVVKDNYHTAGLKTTAGSVALKDFVPSEDAFQVRRVMEAGGIVLCKANLCEWAFHWGHSSSSVLGETRNPYDLSRTTAGSSGGTAGAVATNLGCVGLGTDTGSSIRGPSSHTALVGVRSTMGATSRHGIIPVFERNDIGGPMCRTVEDAARLFGVIVGFDAADPITAHGCGRTSTDYLKCLDPKGLEGARIGVLRLLSEKDEDLAESPVKPLFAAAIEDLKRLGAAVVDPLPIPGFWELALDGTWPRPSQFAHDISAHFKALGPLAPSKSIQQIFEAGLCNPWIKLQFEEFYGSNDPEAMRHPADRGFLDVWNDPKCCAFRDAVVAAMDAHCVDALVYPTWNDPPSIIGTTRGPTQGSNSAVLEPITGLPALTVPMGFSGTQQDLPSGLQMVGRPFTEDTLFRLAYAYEQGTQHRKPPSGFVGDAPSATMPLIGGLVVANGDSSFERGCW